jgi:hypothetical protein
MNMKDWNRRLAHSYTKNTHNTGIPIQLRRDSKLMSNEPTKMLIESRLVSVSELKKEEKSSIRNSTMRKA